MAGVHNLTLWAMQSASNIPILLILFSSYKTKIKFHILKCNTYNKIIYMTYKKLTKYNIMLNIMNK